MAVYLPSAPSGLNGFLDWGGAACIHCVAATMAFIADHTLTFSCPHPVLRNQHFPNLAQVKKESLVFFVGPLIPIRVRKDDYHFYSILSKILGNNDGLNHTLSGFWLILLHKKPNHLWRKWCHLQAQSKLWLPLIRNQVFSVFFPSP